MILENGEIQEGKRQRIKSLHREESVSKYLVITLLFGNIKSNEIMRLPMNGVIVDKLPYDFIIGRSVVEKSINK